MTLGLTRSLALTPFGPKKGRARKTLMGTGGTPSPPGADTFATPKACLRPGQIAVAPWS